MVFKYLLTLFSGIVIGFLILYINITPPNAASLEDVAIMQKKIDKLLSLNLEIKSQNEAEFIARSNKNFEGDIDYAQAESIVDGKQLKDDILAVIESSIKNELSKNQLNPVNENNLEVNKKIANGLESNSLQNSYKIIDYGIANGYWGDEDIKQFKESLRDLNDKERFSAETRVLKAFNDGNLVIDDIKSYILTR